MKTVALLLAGAAVAGAASPVLAPFASSAEAVQIELPWHFEGFPESQHKAPTRFSLDLEDGTQTLRITTDDSYGTLVQRLDGGGNTAAGRPRTLAWRWRLDEPLASSDLRTRAGDDSALKVCVMFDEPLERIALLERTALRLARAAYSGLLPAATVCYLWDGNTYPVGSTGANPYSARVRFVVLRGPQDARGRWFDERRDVTADFQRLFGEESPETPPLLAVAVGADSDNTHGHSTGRLAALRFLP